MRVLTPSSLLLASVLLQSVAALPRFVRTFQCLFRFLRLDLDTAAFDRYGDFFRDDSVFTLAQSGEYIGPDGIEEYVRFVYAESSPYLSERSTPVTDFQFVEYDRDAGMCIFRLLGVGNFVLDPEYTKGGSVETAYMYRVYMDLQERYIPKIDLYLTVPYLEYFFGLLGTVAVSEYVCDVMTGPCASYITTNSSSCVMELENLPMYGDEARFDENNKGCRAVHAVFASTNSRLHCPHISFEPLEDPNGKIKCFVSDMLPVSGYFGDEDLESYSEFCVDQGIDPDTGYRV